ncbi:hypothetical protein PVK64_14825 [Aliivibrio sp. S4TY2]|uniref:Uncharacterized protein n=1 Tax=Aliivibrio finisterrensis TaxID=511998 RepID=A0A4Q5KKR7_9GAMM|nr:MULTISPECIES: hypothetical protein [Aliivibrio]MDD9157445.1 hypothetical protein [Aliivibrio sp. S4TY2]MDD9161361.1 hypothetical protein [Aliivibrio sp. S4TY1]MDD9165391.1 hypothetical protein [Aliivibrio sp. S4MY2]MDD9169354.1 hypothetical protein [Aliivibrio sp. S4MY4]MDD9179234.1 hypothetical protein [Aliivibrio sp. A6]
MENETKTFYEIIETAMRNRGSLFTRFLALKTEYNQIVCGFIHVDFAALTSFTNTDSQFYRIIEHLDPQITICDSLPIEGRLADLVYRRLFKPLEYKDKKDTLINEYVSTLKQDNVLYPPQTISSEVDRLAQQVLEPLDAGQFTHFLYEVHPILSDEIVEFYNRTGDLEKALNVLINFDLNKQDAVRVIDFDKHCFMSEMDSQSMYEGLLNVDELCIYKNESGFVLRDRNESIRISKLVSDYDVLESLIVSDKLVI